MVIYSGFSQLQNGDFSIVTLVYQRVLMGKSSMINMDKPTHIGLVNLEIVI